MTDDIAQQPADDPLEAQLDEILPGRPYPDYNMGLLPDDEGYDEAKFYQNVMADAKQDEAKAKLKALLAAASNGHTSLPASQPDSHDGEAQIDDIVFRCFAQGRYWGTWHTGKLNPSFKPDNPIAVNEATAQLKAYADRLATQRAIDEVKNCREGFVVAYQRYEGNEAADKFLRTIIEVFDERISELTATLTKEGES